MKLYTGLELHSSNSYLGIIDETPRSSDPKKFGMRSLLDSST